MKLLHRYILGQLLRNLLISLMIFVFLFLVFDFFDRIDDILEEDVSIFIIIKYFIYKVPEMISLTLPIAMLVSTMFALGILSKNSEITAMRASGLKIAWLAKPILCTGLALSIFSIAFNELVVPYSSRRVREIYNIDIKEKNRTGRYSQNDFWWRSGDDFYSVNMFDSRTNTLLDLSKFKITEGFRISKRVTANKATHVNPALGWNMQQVSIYRFPQAAPPETTKEKSLPLPIPEKPKDFYNARMYPSTMSFFQLKRFIHAQQENGLSITSYLADLYAKVAFPFVIFIVGLAVIPFSLSPSRSGSMASSFMAGLLIGFSYYAVHSFSIAMGRAEFWNPLLAAWMANCLLGLVGIVLNIGAESPS
ncbi:LPS export ABC transporter permease LptG [Oligoflexia bacterium]|nr:LPS export ABC transporter permease LptG [Oligoflexia bacterium]